MTPLTIHYTLGLVLISVLISMGAAYTALSLADRMTEADPRGQRFWMAGGSISMGIGIWSMHYLGMLAARIDVPVYYHWPTVLLSLGMAIASSFAALRTIAGRIIKPKRILIGGVLMGAGIGGMHYIGMAAMRSTAMEDYSMALVFLSVVVAIGFSCLALWTAVAVRFPDRPDAEMLRASGACIMGLGIASMHYIAMSAATFYETKTTVSMNQTISVSLLGQIGIAAIAVVILLAALGAATVERRKFLKLHEIHTRLEWSQNALLESQQLLRISNEVLSEMSLKDSLTGLSNRRHFDAMLDAEWRRGTRARRPITVLMIDIDCFKLLNDTCGHLRGDDCLREIGHTLLCIPRRGYDVIARYGGEEFVVLLPETDIAEGYKTAEEIRLAVKGLGIANEGSTVAKVVTVSIGVANRIPSLPDDSKSIVAAADLALYGAKRKGKDRVEVCTSLAEGADFLGTTFLSKSEIG